MTADEDAKRIAHEAFKVHYRKYFGEALPFEPKVGALLAGLGTLGLHEKLARRMTEEAGFREFQPLDLGHPVNAFYAVRP